MKTEKELIEIWGVDLYNFFGHHFNNEGWLTNDWTDIIECEIPRWDEDWNDNEEYRLAHSLMYQIDFEESECGKFIRRIDKPFY